MSTPAGRVEGFRALLAHVREAYGLDLGFVLWDGSTVPADLAAGALAIVFADEGVVAALVRRPSFDTVIDLWVSARIDLRKGADSAGDGDSTTFVEHVFLSAARADAHCEPFATSCCA